MQVKLSHKLKLITTVNCKIHCCQKHLDYDYNNDHISTTNWNISSIFHKILFEPFCHSIVRIQHREHLNLLENFICLLSATISNPQLRLHVHDNGVRVVVTKLLKFQCSLVLQIRIISLYSYQFITP